MPGQVSCKLHSLGRLEHPIGGHLLFRSQDNKGLCVFVFLEVALRLGCVKVAAIRDAIGL